MSSVGGRGGLASAVATSLLAIAVLPGCAGLPGAPDQTSAFSIGPLEGRTAPGKPVDLYIRLARQAKACWFVPPALLQRGYVFTADVKPEDKGGAADIIIYERTPEGERGLRAFAVAFVPDGESTRIGSENYRIPEPFGAQMSSDVDRWAEGDMSCAQATPWSVSAAAGDQDAATGKPPAATTSKRIAPAVWVTKATP